MITASGLVIEGYGTVDPITLLDTECGMQLGLSILFLFSALEVSNTANMGFNLLLSSLIFLAFPVIIHLTIHYYKYQLTVGIALGVSVYMCVLNLITSIFWINLSVCERTAYEIAHYSCTNHVGYRWIGLLSIPMLALQVRVNSFELD
jgi:hypothetical protein